ncbi:RNA polymerase sigma factor [candidate division KSB1 bacterium]|nr:RNA polymerase sigma factor [candidate division KSB1 bacterium]RQW08945.1 MAG: RNA polymerase sigma factor [candidate division KSB1 bacterium]
MSDDLQHLIRAQNNDLDSFRQIVERHQQFVYSVAFRLLADPDAARDVAQECFIRLWKNLHRFDARQKLTTWLYKIVLNLCTDDMRRAYNRRRCAAAEEEVSFAQTDSDDVEQAMANAELAAKIRQLSEDLKPRQRAVFVLRDLQDLDMAEIAAILKISVATAKSNLYYARQNIRKKCQELGYLS